MHTDQEELASLSAAELRDGLAAGQWRCTDIAEAVLQHVARTNPRLNALVRVDPEPVMAQAVQADRRLADGDRSPWLGLPFTIKDTLWAQGRIATCGSTLYRDFVAPQDALAVGRLRAAGAVLLAHSNCSEFACKGVTTNLLYGPTCNPWDVSRTPGGSSGGGASAVAAGLGCLGLGTDAGGSTRRPAAHTGVVGMKPSAGRIAHAGGFDEPVYGHSVIGPMARTVQDVVMAMDTLQGPHPDDPQSVGLPAFDPAQAHWQAEQRMRIAYSPRLGLGFPVDADVAAGVARMAQQLADAGHQVELVDPPWPEGASEEALMPLQLAGLAAIYGDRFQAGAWEPDPDIARQIEAGLALDGRAVAAALEWRKHLYAALARLFQDHDLLISPTTPVTAWPLGQIGPTHIEGRPVSPRGHAVFTPIFNHCFVPACSVPCGLDQHGLPIGLQIVGPLHADARVLALASWVEQLRDHDFSRMKRLD